MSTPLPNEMQPQRFFLASFVLEGGLAVLALGIGTVLGLELFHELRVDFEALLQSILATLPLPAAYFILKALPFRGLRRIERIVRRFFRDSMLSLPLWKTVVVAALAGFGEELMFRYLLQKGALILLFRNGNAGAAATLGVILAVSILFGLAHAVTKTYFVFAVLISLYLGVLYAVTGNLLVPILVHALYDLFVFLALRRELGAKQSAF